MRSVYCSCEARSQFRMRIPASAKVFLAAFALTVLQPLSNAPALAQSTCNGMTVGQLTGLNGFVPFPANSLWNTDVSIAPVDPNSNNIINFIGANVTLHPDFGSGTYAGQSIGIPYQVVGGSQPKVSILLGAYADESDHGRMPVPYNALIEGYPAPGSGHRHVLVLDRHGCWLYELYHGRRPINHALRFTVPVTRQAFTPPASHWASSNTNADAPPMGMRLRLKASFDISGFSLSNQVILTALKRYGMILADNGSAIYISGAPDRRWDNSDLGNLKTITASNFEVVLMDAVYTNSNVPTGAPPVINSFTVNRKSILAGQTVTLSWMTSEASYNLIAPTIGPVRGTSITIRPSMTRTFILHSTNQYGQSIATVAVTVH